MSIKIKGNEWKIMYVVSGGLDLVQLAIDFTGIGEVINEIADLVIGVLFAIYFFLRGYSVSRYFKLYLSLLGIEILEEFTAGAAPGWIFDVYYARKIALAEEAQEQADNEQEILLTGIERPSNMNGVRAPSGNAPRPAYKDGVRLPNGGLSS